MKITKNTPDQLVMKRGKRFGLVVLFLAIMTAVVIFLALNPDSLTGDVSLYAAVTGVFTIIMALLAFRGDADIEVIFDHPSDTVTIRWHRKHGTETQTGKLSEIRSVAKDNLDTSARVQLGFADYSHLALTPYASTANHYRTIGKIKKWLDAGGYQSTRRA